jgi:hypothetical protein
MTAPRCGRCVFKIGDSVKIDEFPDVFVLVDYTRLIRQDIALVLYNITEGRRYQLTRRLAQIHCITCAKHRPRYASSVIMRHHYGW